MSAARVLQELLAARSHLSVRREALVVRHRRGTPPELCARVAPVAPQLYLVTSERWRAVLEGWPSDRQDRYEDEVRVLLQDGVPLAEAERIAFLYVHELPAGPVPPRPPPAPPADEVPPRQDPDELPPAPPVPGAPLLYVPPDLDPDDPLALALEAPVDVPCPAPLAPAPPGTPPTTETEAQRAARVGWRLDRWGSWREAGEPDGPPPHALRFAVGHRDEADELARAEIRARVARDCAERLGPCPPSPPEPCR